MLFHDAICCYISQVIILMKKPFAKLFKDQQIINYRTDMSEKAKQEMQERILKAWNSENLWKCK